MSKRTKNSSQGALVEHEKRTNTLIGLHSVKNLLGHEQQMSLFDEHEVESFARTYGVKVNDRIDRLGIDLTDTQSCLMEGILRGFTATNYKGNAEPKNADLFLREQYAFGQYPSIYKNVKEIPCLRVTQSEILSLAGLNKRSFADKQRAVESLKHLGTAQYCFYYDRLVIDRNGVPEKDTNGKWKKEDVYAINTLFTIKEIRDQQDGRLQYYEIMPSPIFLDQRESYFMLVPYNWREEVKALVGSKKASSYTFRFLFFLRYQYELKRRSKKEVSQPFVIKWSWEDIAIAIKMPESLYKRKKDRAFKILDDAYWVAQQLGYLSAFSRNGDIDSLVLNEQKYLLNNGNYYQADEIKKLESQLFSPEVLELFEFFHAEKLKKDADHKVPIAKTKTSHLAEFEKLIKVRDLSEIKPVIAWGLNKKFWCSQIGTPAKLRRNFGEALIEMKNSSTDEGESVTESNKALVNQILKSEKYLNQNKAKIELLNAYVEIGGRSGLYQPTCISFKEKGFKDQFESALRKWHIF